MKKNSTIFSKLEHFSLEKQEYKKTIKELQEEARKLSHYAYDQKRSCILVFEGWDAAGKGGSIRRLTSSIDPRLYHVRSVAAPNPVEKRHNYLWRFWTNIPPKGHICIFDRSWYGRVLVERVEGFAEEKEWRRSYSEIINFEEDLLDAGSIIIKYWLHITPEEQLARFQGRQNDPLKRWKLTDEDWRNREKWDQYEAAALEMFEKTDSEKARWRVIAANDKYYARTLVLRYFCKTLKKELKLD
ncbi:MAG: UDP-galactose-lipid carrier transferase [Spirochaetota bacterium]